MADQIDRRSHVDVQGRVQDRTFARNGRSTRKIRDVERSSHGWAILDAVNAAFEQQEAARERITWEELRAIGAVITIEGARGYPLELDSLQAFSARELAEAIACWAVEVAS